MTIPASFVPRGRNVMTVRVTSYQDRCMKGFLDSTQTGQSLAFSSAVDLLLQIEALMDQSNSPQRNEEHRSFTPGGAAEALTPVQRADVEPLAVFQFNVMFRQNATWQGNLLWVDEGMEAHFRSVLEILHLMDSALANGKDQA